MWGVCGCSAACNGRDPAIRCPWFTHGRGERLSEHDNNPPVSTGRGDDGTTTLLGSGRMGKNDPRIVVLGDVDEASSFLGLARAEAEGELAELLIELQRLLYRVMGDVAMPKEDDLVGEADLDLVDRALEDWRNRTEIPREFVIPGESRLGALLDVARSVVRRAERSLVAAGYGQGHPYAVRVVNRLSDLLFVVARNADGGKTLSKG
ncbi:cob(I)yrinic acid a,c-diamide adenosyltransferase [Rubrobacter tropicus]|uniref:Corrinoid adenosyltransferase n=1 Tax=Rubrobacter tropicus TaxID=2653851 RepID=A0A6G8QEG1_9ACTN|nr:cob(I)yrinic acid a,c-diamide adenosyltransferase [Rubrobacter tropicus]